MILPMLLVRASGRNAARKATTGSLKAEMPIERCRHDGLP
jgi:hypothetical protein